MTITCPYCQAENRVAGYYRDRSTLFPVKPFEVACVKCQKRFEPKDEPETQRVEETKP